MEDDLATLDELEAMQHLPSNSQSSPRQKLLAAKFHELQINDWSVLHYKREELMEKILAKTEQYSKHQLPNSPIPQFPNATIETKKLNYMTRSDSLYLQQNGQGSSSCV